MNMHSQNGKITKDVFNSDIQTMSEFYRKKIPAPVLAIYFEGISKLTVAQWEKAVKGVYNSNQFFPTINDLIRNSEYHGGAGL